MSYQKQCARTGQTERDVAFLIYRVLPVQKGDEQGIVKDRTSFFKADPVFRQVESGLDRIPLKTLILLSLAGTNGLTPSIPCFLQSSTIDSYVRCDSVWRRVASVEGE